jgi:Fe-S-cluster-containing hydrogenase component 2
MVDEKEMASDAEDFGQILKKEREEDRKRREMTRRAFVVGSGAVAAGVVVGGVVGYRLAPEALDLASPHTAPYPSLWMGRNPQACTGCKLCEIACSQEKEGTIWPGASRIRVYQFPPCVEVPVACYLCGTDSECIKGCEVNALSMNPATSTIEVDTTRCLRTAREMGCVACAEACPGKAITFHPETSAPLICDLCGGEPACLGVCPSKAIMTMGPNMAAASPGEIARGMAYMYDLPTSRKGTGSEG